MVNTKSTAPFLSGKISASINCRGSPLVGTRRLLTTLRRENRLCFNKKWKQATVAIAKGKFSIRAKVALAVMAICKRITLLTPNHKEAAKRRRTAATRQISYTETTTISGS